MYHTIHEYEFGKHYPNVHESIYPHLIKLWNISPRHYRKYLTGWHFTHGECEKILDKVQEWAKVQGNQDLYLNEY